MSHLEMVFRILFIIFLSTLIGLDRQLRHKPAGIKTHVLVGLGSTIFMLVSIYIYYEFKAEARTLDPGRIAAQVVTGIGFLGAGTIIQSRGSVTGLTTAASLWSVAGIGLAVGTGMYFLATISAAAIIIVFLLMDRVFGIVEHGMEEAADNRLTHPSWLKQKTAKKAAAKKKTAASKAKTGKK